MLLVYFGMILGEFWDDPGRVLGCSWESFAQTARAPSGQSTNDPVTFGNDDDDDDDDDDNDGDDDGDARQVDHGRPAVDHGRPAGDHGSFLVQRRVPRRQENEHLTSSRLWSTQGRPRVDRRSTAGRP